MLKSSAATGGAERQLDYLLRGLNRTRIETHVFTMGAAAHETSDASDSVVPCYVGAGGVHSLGTTARLAAAVAWRRLTILQSFLFLDNQVGRVAAAMCRVPIITCVRGDGVEGRWRTLLEYRLHSLSARVVVNSAWMKERLVVAGIPREKIAVIPNGIDLRLFRAAALDATVRQRFAIPDGAYLIGMFGRYHPMKDHETFLRVLEHLLRQQVDAYALLVGSGDLAEVIEQRVSQLGLGERVRMVSAVPAEIPGLMRACDATALTSRWGESLPNVVLEAQALGVPVVASRVSGVPELIEDGRTGFLVEPGDVESFASRLEALRADDLLRQRVIAAGRDQAHHFSLEAMVARFEELYEEVLGQVLS